MDYDEPTEDFLRLTREHHQLQRRVYIFLVVVLLCFVLPACCCVIYVTVDFYRSVAEVNRSLNATMKALGVHPQKF